MLIALSSAVTRNARTSFGKHEPPQPGPGSKNLLPILESLPIPNKTSFAFAPTDSHKAAISFTYESLIARKLLDAYFINSAEELSVIIV